MRYSTDAVRWMAIQLVRVVRHHRLWHRMFIVLVAFGYLITGLPARAHIPTAPLSDINPGAASSSPGELSTVNDTLFFVATTDQTGRELWKTDGTRAGTVLVKDINAGTAHSSPTELTSVGGKLFFFADNGTTGMELWVSDGTAAGTTLVEDIAPDETGVYDINFVPRPLDLNGVLIFGVHYSSNSRSYSGLWRSDGTAAGTTLVKDLHYPGFGPARYMVKLGNTVFFTADDGTPYSHGLWKTDGTRDGTMVVKSLQYITELQPVQNSVFFKGGENPGITADELWKTDGTVAGTVLVRDIHVGNQGSDITEMTEFKGQLFFQATGGDQHAHPPTATGRELWKSDGTMEGTVLVKDIAPGFIDSRPTDLTPVDDTLYFAAMGKLWKSDGTEAGTVHVKGISTGHDPAYPGGLTNIDGKLLFWADDGTHGREPWVSDGTAACTKLIQDLSPGASSSASSAAGYVDVASQALFSADDGRTGTELWALTRHVDALVQLPTLTYAKPMSVVSIPVQYDNAGIRTASHVILRATLDPHLSYIDDSSGVTPTINGQIVQWSLPDIKVRCGTHFVVRVRTPKGALNSAYSIKLDITSNGSEADVSDNTAEATVALKEFVYLPGVRH